MGVQVVNSLDIALVFLLSLFLTYMVTKFSSRMGMLDIPNERSSHINPIPRGAGVAIFLAYLSGLVFCHFDFIQEHIGFITGSIIIFLVGVYDDNKGVNPKSKFIFITLATLAIFFIDHLGIKTLGTWYGYSIDLPLVISLLVTTFAVIGFTNALNLIDGLDGLSGSVSIVIFGAFYYIGMVYHDSFIMIISSFMIAAIVAFIFFNWHPAKIFMGDSGSLVLGFTISVVAIKSIDYISITAVLFLTAIPIIDTLTVMIRRIQRGLSPFNPDKTHLHHKVLRWKGGVDNTVVIIAAIQFVFSFMGLALRRQPDEVIFFLFAITLLLAFAFLDERAVARERTVITKIRKKGIKFIKDNLNKYIISAILLIMIVIVIIMKLNSH